MKTWYLSFITNWFLLPKLELCTSIMTWDLATRSILSHSQIPSVLYIIYYFCYMSYNHYDLGYVLPLQCWVVVEILQPCYHVYLDCLSKMNLALFASLLHLVDLCCYKNVQGLFLYIGVYNSYKWYLKTRSLGRFLLAWWLTH